MIGLKVKRMFSSLQRRQYTLRNRTFSRHLKTVNSIETKQLEQEQEQINNLLIQRSNLLQKTKLTSSKTTTTTTGLHVLDLIEKGALNADRGIYHELLKRCTHLNKLSLGRIVHAHLGNFGFLKTDTVLQNSVVNMYAKCGSLDVARKVFDEMRERDVVSWTALISGYAQCDSYYDACMLFYSMLREGVGPNQFTLSSVLKACSTSVGMGSKFGVQVHGFCFKCGFDSDVYVGSALLDLYAKFGQLEEAHFIFDGLASKNDVSWNSLVAGYARFGQGDMSFRLFSDMLRENVEPTKFTYSTVLNACASMGSMEQGKWVHARLVKSGAGLVSFIGNTLLDMYAKSGGIEDAKRVFDRLVKRDVISWNSMLKGYAQHGLGKLALQKFEEMLRIGIAPNDISFLCVLTACSHAGLLDEGLHYFKLMKKYKVEPDISHYVTMVDLFGRAGFLDNAANFIKEMPIEPTAAVWGALLGACRMHKNMELGTYAAECIFQLEPKDSGPHMLLYNMYASAYRWSDAAKVRKITKDSGLKKEPACSWVQIKNVVHMFVAGDDEHPLKEEIHRKWEEIRNKIEEIGFVPDTSHVLLFVDEQERELKLQYHSEKLALAFALLKTPHGSTIQIKKNIRICGDCHLAFKFVSKVENREIIVRDTNRFHHFRDGSCSCGDYW